MKRHRFTKRKTRAQRVAFRVAKRREYAAEIRASRQEWLRGRCTNVVNDMRRVGLVAW